MSEQCPYCHSILPEFWWEQKVPQWKWTEQQRQAYAARQQGALANALRRAERPGESR